jgi:hypothetical protein
VQNTPSGRSTIGCAIPNAGCYQPREVRKAEGAVLGFVGQERFYPVKRPFGEILRQTGWAGKAVGAGRSGLNLRNALQNSTQTGADLLGGVRARRGDLGQALR